MRVGTRVRVPLHGRTVRGWVVDGRRRRARRASSSCPLKSWLGWGPPPALVELADVGGLALGRTDVVLPAGRPPRPRSCATLPAPPAPRPVAGGRDERSDDGATTRLGPAPAASRARRWCACRRRPTSSTSCSPWWTTRPCRDPGGSAVVLVPSTGWAERLAGPARAPGLPRHELVGGGAGGVAGRGREPGRRLGARAAAGRRRRARCARCGLPGGERAHLQRGRRGARAGPP